MGEEEAESQASAGPAASDSVEISEVPYAAALDKDVWEEKRAEKWCFVCFAATPLELCSICEGCNAAYYCSEECRRRDLEVTEQHRFECAVFDKFRRSPDDWKEIATNRDTRLVGRIVARLAVDGGESPDGDFAGFPSAAPRRKFFDLMDHPDKNADSPGFHRLWRVFQHYFKAIPSPNPYASVSREMAARIYGIVRTNSFRTVGRCSVFEMPERVGLAVYVQCSRFDHSCSPEITRYFDGWRLMMRSSTSGSSLSRMSAAELERQHISYHCWDGSLAQTLERSESLLAAFHFVCACPKCGDEGNDRLEWTCVREECGGCGEALVPSMAGEEDWRDPLRSPNIVFLYPDEALSLPLVCPACGQGQPERRCPKARFYECMRNSMLAAFAVKSDFVRSAPVDDSHYLYDRLKDAETTLHSTKNAWVFLAREVLLDVHFEPAFRESGREKDRLVCIDLAKKLVQSWDYFEPAATEAQVLCAKIGRWHALGAGEEAEAGRWYAEAARRWAAKYGPTFHVVRDLEDLIRSLRLSTPPRALKTS